MQDMPLPLHTTKVHWIFRGSAKVIANRVKGRELMVPMLSMSGSNDISKLGCCLLEAHAQYIIASNHEDIIQIS